MGKKIFFKSSVNRSLNYGRHHINDFLRLANKKPVNAVLDVGAGWGNDLLLASNHNPTCALHAIEIDKTCQQSLEEKGMIVHPLNIEHDKFPFKNESIDIVIANQIIEHLKEIFWFFHEVTRVLPVGGSFIIGVPNLASLHNRLLLALGKQPTCIQNHSAHVRGYTKSDLIKLFKICFPGGYSLQKFGGSNFYPFPPLIAKPLASLFPNMAWSIFMILKKEREYNNEFLTHPRIHQLETNFFLGN